MRSPRCASAVGDRATISAATCSCSNVGSLRSSRGSPNDSSSPRERSDLLELMKTIIVASCPSLHRDPHELSIHRPSRPRATHIWNSSSKRPSNAPRRRKLRWMAGWSRRWFSPRGRRGGGSDLRCGWFDGAWSRFGATPRSHTSAKVLTCQGTDVVRPAHLHHHVRRWVHAAHEHALVFAGPRRAQFWAPRRSP